MRRWLPPRPGLLAAVITLLGCLPASEVGVAAVGLIDHYDVKGGHILRNGRSTVFTGVNALHVYGGNSSAIAAHNFSIVREFVGNVQYQPIDTAGGYSFKSPDGAWLQPLRKILDHNRAMGLATILDLHRWNESHATEFWATTPSLTPWWEAYKTRLLTVFLPFVKGRPDVWLSPWNEPFAWDYTVGVHATLLLWDRAHAPRAHCGDWLSPSEYLAKAGV